jgi:beta-phosphoglucomutase-like phosphatase (HAD superfamily)
MKICGQDDPAACIVVDDQPRNLMPAAALGMGTVLVGSSDRLDGIDHAILRASDLLAAVPTLAGGRAHPPPVDRWTPASG